MLRVVVCSITLVSLFVATSTAKAGDPAAGKKIVVRCVACHGQDGIGKMPDVPNLAGESAIYQTTQLEAYRSGRRDHPQMSIIAKGLSDTEIADVSAWYAALKVTVELPDL